MKKILLCGVLLCLITLMSSCDKEEITSTHQQQFKKVSFQMSSENPYDEVGLLYNVLFDTYLTLEHTVDSIEDIAIEVNRLITIYTSLEQTTIPVNSEFTDWIEQIVNNPEDELDVIVSETDLSIRAKAKLNNLINLVSGVTITNYDETLITIISYEKEIIIDVSLTLKEKEIILTVSSILKYSLYDNGDRKDKDWDLSVGNIVATVYGATHSRQDALLMGLTVKIFQNHFVVNQ